jgi:hypothetical protein
MSHSCRTSMEESLSSRLGGPVKPTKASSRGEAARSVQWSAINAPMMPINAAAIDTKSAPQAN